MAKAVIVAVFFFFSSFFFSFFPSGTGPLFSDRDASSFPVPVSGSAESAAGGAVVPGRGAGAGAGALRRGSQSGRCSRRAGRGGTLVERGCRGTQSLVVSEGAWPCTRVLTN